MGKSKRQQSETEQTLRKVISYAEMGSEDALSDAVVLCEQLQNEGMQVLSGARQDETVITYDQDNFAKAHELIKEVRRIAADMMRSGRCDPEKCEGVYFDCLRFDAPFDFDAFMLYIERDRPREQQYWLPRRGKLLHIAQALQSMEDGDLDELFLSMPPRTGKALANDTPVLTSKGWKNHGDLAVGDEVIGLDGKFKKVIAVHPKCMLDVMVEFTNGEKIQCHERHEWMLYDRARGKMSTKETIYYEGRCKEYGGTGRGHRYVFQLPSHGVVEGIEKHLPMDPYSLGVWLGDGSNRQPRIANDKHDKAIIDRMVSNGCIIKNEFEHKETGVMYYDFDFRKTLESMGMCHSRKRLDKRIPEEYLTASVKDRLNLLAGLIDTDGTFVKNENRYHFCTCDYKLAEDFVSLVSTFGWRCSSKTEPPKESTSGIVGKKDTIVIGFNPTMKIPCSLKRKQNETFSEQRSVSLKSITRVEPKEGNCITVEGDGMYLAGKSLTPTHNTTLIMFFFVWVMCRHPEKSNLYCTYTQSVADAFFTGILEVFKDPVTYRWNEAFPGISIANTNAKDLMINLNRKKRYASFSARSLYGSLNGAVDCNGYEVADDLVSGIEEAMSKDRLDGCWLKVDNNYLPRAKEGSKRLWIGTRWAQADPSARRSALLEQDGKFKNIRWKFINTPALDENDNSNFEYLYGVGFSSEFYQQRRASFERNGNMADWFAQYQGQPIDRVGAVFEPDDLRYFNGELPDDEPDRVFMAVDPAWGGGDYVASPVIAQYGEDMFVVDVVYDNGDKNKTWANIKDKVAKYGVQAITVEATRATSSYAEGLNNKLREDGIRINVQSSVKNWAGGIGKEQRVFDKAPDIRECMLFVESGKRTKEYQQFMDCVYAFKIGMNKHDHDDAPDSLAQAITMAFGLRHRAKVISRSRFGL